MTFNLDFLKQKVWQVDGVTVTVGLILVIVIVGYVIMRARRG